MKRTKFKTMETKQAEQTTEPREIYYYRGITIDYQGKRQYSYQAPENRGIISFKTKIKEAAVGMGIEVTVTATGVKGPYAVQYEMDRHPEWQQWYLEDRNNRLLLQVKQTNSKAVPSKVEEFENLLKELTYGMGTRQRQLFLMKYMF